MDTRDGAFIILVCLFASKAIPQRGEPPQTRGIGREARGHEKM